jgi:hypothetical protein
VYRSRWKWPHFRNQEKYESAAKGKNKLGIYAITNVNWDLNWSLIFCIYVNVEMAVNVHFLYM